MYREITEKLKIWKDSKRRKPLLVSGVRQCGKTYIIKHQIILPLICILQKTPCFSTQLQNFV